MTKSKLLMTLALCAQASLALAEPIDLYCEGHCKSFPAPGDPPGIEGNEQIRVTVSSDRTEARVYSTWSGEDIFPINVDELTYSVEIPAEGVAPTRIFLLNRHSLEVEYYRAQANSNKPWYSFDGTCRIYKPEI